MQTVNSAGTDSTVEQILAEVTACVRQVPAESLIQAMQLMESSARIFVAGAGRSGLCMRALGMRLMHLGKTVYVVGETTTPGIEAKNLLVIGSGSGKTRSLLAMAEQAQLHGAKILLFTADATSPLAALADHRVIIPAPSLKTVQGVGSLVSAQPLGTLFEQSMLILCDSLIMGLMQQLGVDAAQMSESHANLE